MNWPISIKFKGVTLLLLFIIGLKSWATPEDVSVLIPLEFRNIASGGLVYQGVEITPEEAINLHQQGHDISELNPREETDIWRNQTGQPLQRQQDALLFDPERDVRFLEQSSSFAGTIEFTVQQNDAQNIPHLYVVRVSRKIHSVHLRKSMLRKIGYIIPPSQHLRRLNVRFDQGSTFERNRFLKSMWQNLSTGQSRWIRNFYGTENVSVENSEGEQIEQEQYLFLPRGISNDHTDAKQLARTDPQEMLLEFQDVLIYPLTNQKTLNLGLGFISSDINQNLRLLNAVILVYSLTDVPESINKFTWHIGRVRDNYLVLPYEEYPYISDQYNPNYEDARWIMERVAQLTEDDFTEIAYSAHYPEEIAQVVREKLISRRNYLVRQLHLNESEGRTSSLKKKDQQDHDLDNNANDNSNDLPHLNPNELNSEHVNKGIVTKDFWPGHGPRFAHSEMESPLSGTEVFSFFRSKILSNLLSNLVRQVNERLRYVDLRDAWHERQVQLAEDNFFEFLRTGQTQKTPLGMWAQPTLNGRLSFARELVLGTYMGVGGNDEETGSMVHLADTFGFGMDAGVIGIVEGLGKRNFASIGGNVFFSRNYTHLTPVTSIRASLKKPIQHIMVNFYKNNTAELLNEILDEEIERSRPEPNSDSHRNRNPFSPSPQDNERQEKIRAVLDAFSENFQVGDSLVITDTLGDAISVTGRYGLADNVAIQSRIGLSQIVISRLHIQRADENTIHIYRDYGNLNSLRLSFGMDAHIPLVKLSLKINGGRAKTLYHRLDITANESENPFLLDNLLNLQNVMLKGSLEMFPNNPVVLEHHFYERVSNFQLFSYRRTSLNSRDRIVITHPNGEMAEFIRSQRGRRQGLNWQALGLDSVNALMREKMGRDIILNMASNDNPGDTLKGRSQYRLIRFDSRVEPGGEGQGQNIGESETLSENFIHINHRWKGWSLSANKANDIVEEVNSRFAFEFFDPRVLSSIRRLLLYVIDLNIFVYEPGIEYLLGTSTSRARALFHHYSTRPQSHSLFPALVTDFTSNQRKCREERSGQSVRKALRPCMQMVGLIEEYVRDTNGLMAFFGGRENFRMDAKILGYREGDEGAYEPILSNVFGEVGAARPFGPLMGVLDHPDFRMAHGEFFIYWLMTKL